MKKTLLLLVFVGFFSCKSHEKIMKKKAKSDYTVYHKYIRDKNFIKAVEFVNPEVFIFVPKKMFVDALEGVYRVDNVEYRIYSPTKIEVSNFTTFKDKEYVKLTANYHISVRFLDFVNVKNQTMTMMKTTLKESLNAQKVDYNAKTNVFHVEVQEQLYAVYNEGWKFMAINKYNKKFIEKIIPEEVLIELENLYGTNK